MKVIFETAGGQQLQAELSGQEEEAFVKKIFLVCKDVRDYSVRDVMAPDRIREKLSEYTLLVKEAPAGGR